MSENKTFDALNPRNGVAGSDILVVAETGTDVEAKKTTVTDLAAAIDTELGLGTAATTDSSAYASSDQGAAADSALQPGDVDLSTFTGVSNITITNTAGNNASLGGATQFNAGVMTASQVTTLGNAIQPNDPVSSLNNDAGYITSAPVTSVNTKTGNVVLTAEDVGAVTEAPNDGVLYGRQSEGWVEITSTGSGAVDSVNEKTGVVVLTGDDINLANDDSTKIHAAVDTIKATTDIAVTSEAVSGGAGGSVSIPAGSVDHIVQLSQSDYEALQDNGDIDPDIIYVITGGDVTVTANVQGAATNTVNRIVTIDQAAYDGLGGSADPNTLYVIEDGVTKDSYNGQIETPADKSYTLDAKAVTDREITGVYVSWTAGVSPDGDIDVLVGGTSVITAKGRMNSGTDFTATIKNDGTEDASAGDAIVLVLGGTNAVANVTDLVFVVEYAV